MIGLVLAAAAVGAVAGQPPVPGQLEVIPSVTVESQAGEAPLTYGDAPKASLVEILTPGVALNYVGRRLELRASYDLRIFWRLTSGVSVPAPLYLNTVNLALTARPARRTTVKLTASVYEGEADYTYLPSIYGANQAALVVVPTIFSANVSGSAELRATQRVTAAIALLAVETQPVGAAPTITSAAGTTTVFTLPRFSSIAATPGANILLSRLDTLEPALSFEYQQVSNLTVMTASGVEQGSLSAFVVTPTLGMRRLLSRRSELTLKVGVGVAHLSGEVIGNPNPIGPVGSATLDARVLNLRQAVLRAKGTSTLDYYIDPVLGTAATRFTNIGGLYLGLPKSWTIGIDGSFVTSLAKHPYPGALNTYPDEVGASLELPVRHLLSNDLMMEFGGRWSDRSPFFTAPNYGFHQRQLWLYVQLTGTTRPTWSLQRGVAPNP